MTCCCDKGDTLDEDYPYDQTLLSFTYIEKMTEELENVDEGVSRNPFNEWRQRQNINEERNRQQNARFERYNPQGSQVYQGYGAGLRASIKKTIKQTISRS